MIMIKSTRGFLSQTAILQTGVTTLSCRPNRMNWKFRFSWPKMLTF